MLNCRRRADCALLIAVIFLFNGCRKSAETGATSKPPENPPAQAVNAPTMPKSAERHHRMFMGGISPLIVSMSPDTIPFRDGHVPEVRYSLTYEIDHPEKATKAYISIYARGVGEVQRFEVDVQPRAQIDFLLDASSFDLGPTVRFRAHCPFGTTDWFTMGGDPLELPQSPSGQEIGNVTPAYVATPKGLQQDGGVPIEIWGVQFTRECTPEMQVSGTTVELKNVVARDRQLNGLLLYSDLQGRPVVFRHFEVNLVVDGPGIPAADVYNLNFVE